MAIYWILLIAPSLFSLAGLRRDRNGGIIFAALFLLFFVAVGFRDDVGMDWGNYQHIYDSMAGVSLRDIRFEASFFLINLAAQAPGLGLTFVNVVHAVVFLVGLFYFASKKCYDKFLALAIATPYLVIVVGMSGIRQAAAIGVFMYLLAIWNRAGNVTKILLILVASTFHASAIVLTSLVLADTRKHPIRLFLVGIAVLAAGLYVLGNRQDYYMNAYVENNLESAGAVYHSLLVVAPAAIYVLFRKRFIAASLFDPVIFKMALLSICIFPLLAISSTGVDRMMLYFTPVQIYVFSALGRVFRWRAMNFLMLLINAGVLFVWLEYANNAAAWTSYGWCFSAPSGCFN